VCVCCFFLLIWVWRGGAWSWASIASSLSLLIVTIRWMEAVSFSFVIFSRSFSQINHVSHLVFRYTNNLAIHYLNHISTLASVGTYYPIQREEKFHSNLFPNNLLQKRRPIYNRVQIHRIYKQIPFSLILSLDHVNNRAYPSDIIFHLNPFSKLRCYCEW
jgi:hypothetical protein